MNDTVFYQTLEQACKMSFEETIRLNETSVVSKDSILLNSTQKNMLAQKILALPEEYIGLLFLKYIFHSDDATIENILDITNIKGHMVFVEEILCGSLQLADTVSIHQGSMEKACKVALPQYIGGVINTVPPISQPVYSPRFRKALKLIKSAQRKPRLFVTIAKRVAVFFMVIIIAFATTLAVNAKLREEFFRWLVNTFPQFSEFIAVDVVNTPNISFDILKTYSPGYIPEGFTEYDVLAIDPAIIYVYRNAQGQFITFQGKLPDETAMMFDTEDTEIEAISILGNSGYCWDRDGLYYLVWQQDGFEFSIVTDLGKDSAVQIAQSIRSCN